MDEIMQTFACSDCGHDVQPKPLSGERGNQEADCTACGAKFTRTFARFEDEWVFGLWRSVETGKVACSYYKTAFGTHSEDC